MAAPFVLKEYQAQSLDVLRDYLKAAQAPSTPNAAFYARTGVPYLKIEQLGDIPYVCLRIPTGGGKTVMAAHAIGIAATAWMKTDQPTVIWFVPSKTILTQTLATLRDRTNPNRQALAERFGENVRIMDVSEALYAQPADYDGGAVIIVSTIQAFRVDNTEGRKVYEMNGELKSHFSSLPPALSAGLEMLGDAIVPSLANVFRLRRPLIIADEAHNMSTELSFDTLGRIAPIAVVEFTATPTTHAEHRPEEGHYASNVLHHVSASELKAAEMIKLPVVLRGRPDPKETIADAIAGLHLLAEKAAREQAATGEFIRPVMLLQAEAKSKVRETLHPEMLKKMLVRDFNVPADEIALATGDSREIDGVDLFDPACPLRFIITQQALREGWDCSFAYVLCSIASQRSERSVEQLLGRVLRMPYAKRKKDDDLNSAYAYATTTDFLRTASLLKDSLVANGFERIEAEGLVQPSLPGLDEGGAAYTAQDTIPDHLDAAPVKQAIEFVTGGRIFFNLDDGTIHARSNATDYDRKHAEMIWPAGEAVIAGVVRQARTHHHAPPVSKGPHVAFNVPALTVRVANRLELFDRDHFLSTPWPLDQCDPRGILDDFVDVTMGDAATIDISKAGRVEVFDFTANLPGLLMEAGWTLPRLTNWLDRKLPLDERRDIMPVSSKLFIGRALDAIAVSTGHSIEELGRAKFRILDALLKTISRYRRARQSEAWQEALFGPNALDYATSAAIPFTFDNRFENDYCYNKIYSGPRFQKHFYTSIGDLKAEGEEFDCARHIDRHPDVRTWFRNVEKKSNSFWLQTSSDKFYPDFVALLNDGRILVVEYKGESYATNDDSKEKDLLGRLWADASRDPKCLFLMCVNRQFGAIDRIIREGH
ncbi:DEAD/DEAH box helicase family protein [Rhizobiales bacterium TNE-4]|nr:DEAD/DEAH box helicase family protein [Rhizobiales bacterium TNE-4]MBV1826063.1 DEAD/DEAH box helicase family protein [Rhizobiales bacterium TNE-4]